MLEESTALLLPISISNLIQSVKDSGSELINLFDSASCLDVIPTPGS